MHLLLWNRYDRILRGLVVSDERGEISRSPSSKMIPENILVMRAAPEQAELPCLIQEENTNANDSALLCYGRTRLPRSLVATPRAAEKRPSQPRPPPPLACLHPRSSPSGSASNIHVFPLPSARHRPAVSRLGRRLCLNCLSLRRRLLPPHRRLVLHVLFLFRTLNV